MLDTITQTSTGMAEARILAALERKVLWLSAWTVHYANHLRPNADGVKVGGHQASSASVTAIMTALYLGVLRPEDRVAVKPHASPVFHAIQYLLGNQPRSQLERFRALGGAQSYPSRTKDRDDVDFSTGSVGLGAAQTIFASLVQDYLRLRGWCGTGPEGRMIAIVGDAEMDEGNIYEALLEGARHGLRNTWWVVDYNRQSLDAVIGDGVNDRLLGIFATMGWEVVVLKHGLLQQAAFAETGGERLRAWIDACPNALYAALTFGGGAAWRRRLEADLGGSGDVSALLARRSDEELAALMTNLGGHDIGLLLDAFRSVGHDRPVCFLAYTIKGMGLPLAGHKDNHAGLLNPEQMAAWRASMGIRPGHEWDIAEGLDIDEAELRRFLAAVPFNRRGPRRLTAPALPIPEHIAIEPQVVASTQAGFGQLMHALARSDAPIADRIVTTSPDVTVSTNLGGWVGRRGLFARETRRDTFREEKIPSAFRWEAGPGGQHVELGIAEMNLFLMLSALGLSDSLFGERLIPVGTLYDPFVCRGLDALNYACYQDARFILAGTPSGITLAPEGGAHQSIGTPMIGMAQPGLSSFEPAFVDELAAVLEWSLAHVQAPGAAGGSVYLRLSTRPLEQPRRVMTPALTEAMVAGGYWLREPGPNCAVAIAYSGAVAPEAIAAAGRLAGLRRDVGVLAVTSADRLFAGWRAAETARMAGEDAAPSHVEQLLRRLPRHCCLVTVTDAHPAALGWLGSVEGHRTKALGVDRFGQSGSVGDLYREYGLDTDAILRAAELGSPGPRLA